MVFFYCRAAATARLVLLQGWYNCWAVVLLLGSVLLLLGCVATAGLVPLLGWYNCWAVATARLVLLLDNCYC